MKSVAQEFLEKHQNWHEEIGKRNLITKTFSNGSNQKISQIHIGHIHYKDKNIKTLYDIDTRFVPISYGWEMRKASYELEVPEYADNWFKFINSFILDPRIDSEHNLPEETISIKPIQIGHIKGQLITEGHWAYKSILYKDAYGQDVDLFIQARNVAFDKLIRINKKPTDLSQDLEFKFQIELGNDTKILLKKEISELTTEEKEKIILLKENIKIYIKDQILREAEGNYEEARKLAIRYKEALSDLEDETTRKMWDKVTTIETFESIILGTLKKTWFRDFKVWDSDGNIEDCKVKLIKKKDNFYLIKTISKEFLATAIYPVYSDTTATYYAGAGDGHVRNTGDTWDTCHDATVGMSANYTAEWATGIVALGDGSMDIRRGFFPIDTSGLPDTANISAALLKVNLYGSVDNDNDGDDYLVVIQTTQASTSELITADYNQCGSVTNPTEGSDQKELTGIGTGYKTWTLNATGRGWISKISWTKLGIREGHDCLNHASVADNSISTYWSDMSDTTYDPYLEVTYTTVGVSIPVIMHHYRNIRGN